MWWIHHACFRFPRTNLRGILLCEWIVQVDPSARTSASASQLLRTKPSSFCFPWPQTHSWRGLRSIYRYLWSCLFSLLVFRPGSVSSLPEENILLGILKPSILIDKAYKFYFYIKYSYHSFLYFMYYFNSSSISFINYSSLPSIFLFISSNPIG